MNEPISRQNIISLAGLLIREGRHSNVWFKDHLITASMTITTLLSRVDQLEKTLRIHPLETLVLGNNDNDGSS